MSTERYIRRDSLSWLRGEEGHSVTMDLSLAPESRPTLVEDPAAAPQEKSWRPPAWAIIGGLLLLSIIPALALRRRAAGEPARAQAKHDGD